MYVIEWAYWKMVTESKATRLQYDQTQTPAQIRAMRDVYEDEIESSLTFEPASDAPKARGPVYEFNDHVMEVRAGASEEKRGLITLCFIGGLIPVIVTWAIITFGYISLSLSHPKSISVSSILLDLYMLAVGGIILYLYFRFGFRLTQLEALTSRNLLVRLNRTTQQVYLHRPSYCGGIVTLPWKSTASSATCTQNDAASAGTRLALVWHPMHTGLPHMEMAFVGKQGQGGSELRDEWEFIRRFMEEGPEGLPRPRLSTRFPSPIQAFSAQFEGIGRFFRKSSWLFKVAMLMVWPAFVVLGTCHWVSLMLCWRPRWPKIIREAGQPGKPIPPLTTLSDYPPDIQKRLLANADRWALKPGKRPEKKPRKPRKKKTPEPDTDR